MSTLAARLVNASRSFAVPLACCVSLWVLGCGEGFDPASEVRTLRVLGVQKDIAYPAPGERVNVRMLWHDGFPAETPRDVQVSWIFGCTNPPGNAYYGCLEQFASVSNLRLATGDTASFTVPDDILENRQTDPGRPVFGVSFVYFALCAGELGIEQPRRQGALPLVCRNAAGELQGPNSFVVGYVALYTYEGGFRNANPLTTGFMVQGANVESCVDEQCLSSAPEPIDCAAEPGRCFPACAKDGDGSCPAIDIRPIVDPESAERDEVSRTFFGRDVGEQMWINYYVDRGSVRSDVRLLNDASVGWNASYGTSFYAPAAAGPVTLWAVVHDNRGGASWARTQIQIQ